MTTDVTVRPCVEADVAALSAEEPPGADIATRMFARQQRGETAYLLAEVDGDVVGYGELVLDARPELRHLQVKATYRGRGIGTALIRAAEQRCPTSHLWIGVGLDNPQARRLYLRLGYRPTGEQVRTTYTYVDDDGPHVVTETSEWLVKALEDR